MPRPAPSLPYAAPRSWCVRGQAAAEDTKVQAACERPALRTGSFPWCWSGQDLFFRRFAMRLRISGMPMPLGSILSMDHSRCAMTDFSVHL
jgi:hypothetical protein